ncbi:MAG: GTP 3',8-cyclase MoaA [Cytophagaceae bacterium]|nr:GTP 3',8-cyclase MoaA [Cytophagaceae bacterium]MBK9508526.1 GTP 3',8-cyclase MoaA [Cytophagaceae bacterium]MBK9935453.1 GTP 3',8-cyclase MoaA [Cytophagaceae bacterium]MBL0301894.1 GTP 3',8-cyclase MoaA [Cytophagaceae bacterium]MBL0324721.1 GTP 3',8-cyclase MoaA [Cytophagaceae bacterium]
MLTDNHGRPINYLRLAVTDRCNLRCFYCMPHDGIDFLPKNHLLSYEEMIRLVSILAKMGISKVRITGGEPFVRKDLMAFLWKLSEIPGIEKINLTTNGVLTAPHVPELKRMGISAINLSLDSLDRKRFFEMTRRDELPNVLKTYEAILEHNIPLKINSVMMAGKNEEDIFSLIELSRNQAVDVRFIEEMPFNGEGAKPEYFLSFQKILEIIKSRHPYITKIQDEPFSTSYNYSIPGYKGNIGIIAAYSRTFCGTCNRMRITPIGDLKTCLYADAALNLRDLLRNNAEDELISNKILNAFQHRAKDGFEAEIHRTTTVHESMTTIGG